MQRDRLRDRGERNDPSTHHLGVAVSLLLTYDSQLKLRTLAGIARVYQAILPLFALLGALFLVARAVRAVIKRRAAMPSMQDVLSIAVVAGGGLLVAILATLTVSYSAGFSPEYLASFVPLMLFALSVAAVLEGTVAYRLLRPHFADDSVALFEQSLDKFIGADPIDRAAVADDLRRLGPDHVRDKGNHRTRESGRNHRCRP